MEFIIRQPLSLLLLLLVSYAVIIVTPCCLAFTSPIGPRQSAFSRHTHPKIASFRVDIDVDAVFGSANQSTGGVSWGADDDDGDFIDPQKIHQDRVAELLQEDNKDFKEIRRQKKWGKFANITNTDELRSALQKEMERVDAEHELKASMAALSGVEYSVLEARETGSRVFDEGGNVHITAGSKSWFAEVDDELENEWQTLTGDQGLDVQVDDTSGKIVTRDALAGVRVGSAGGWTLEVFPGDFVVHRKYGIGRFERTCLRPKTKLTPEEKKAQEARRGEILTAELKKISGGVTPKDIQDIRSKFGTDEDTDPISNPQSTVLEISYADSIVHVPVERAYRISRYRAGDAVVKPKLSRVRGEAWAKAKRRVEDNTLEIAQDVLALYATREMLQRPPFDPLLEDTVKQFEKTFPFEPTTDQKKCFEDIENDMVWKSRPMDRLVCGDVGFGKTEVAFRALFRTVVNGKQAAFLAPTGVLAAQHYKNIVQRMAGFDVNISLLRGGMTRTTRVGREIREEIESGKIQLIVGTHALLSNDLKFKNLGLLVVDEEQRFGVKQKERLKLISSGIDVLTLTATPIPRTLQMSLSGIRDTSTIRSPPPMRKSTITYVQDFSEEMVANAIQTELDRGGQCYYVVPRISMLADAEALMVKLFPDIRIIQAHGRMQRGGAEENVAKFAEGNYDVLLATTVIENGVDIPSVNTIIVQNSQAFGMSTLYQLRGRVGRSNQQGYAYFLHREDSVTEQAAMRLQAIGELSELGAGFDVANRDLEIRGAGSLLGTEQSGMAAKVGFDLYMRMLKKSIRKLRGLDLPVVPRTNILLDTGCTPSTFKLPPDFIPDESKRRIEESKARLAESTAALVNITSFWKSEYGQLPASLQSQLKTMHLHACTRRLGIDLVGFVKSDEEGMFDCVLRSPGLRPRHWGIILSEFPRPAAPKGLDVVFPSRFTLSGEDEMFLGGKKIDLKLLTAEESVNEEEEEEVWDAMDQEEQEALRDIASAVNVESMDEIDIDQYPRFVIRNFESESKAVDALLKLLLPISKVVHEKQESQAEQAKAAVELRKKQDLLRNRKATMEKYDMQRMNFEY
ncbi:transcription-repair coupling factor [Fistulifera solaris]|jgi:transcription-repair coupling factor (superfamily II helicase)|uniref:Transcription-repair coupling factor n=1 Tax=Fistulifera solaris TaxID=1519565 RepID=A0A1Z5K3S5_FISSO|nr:transcription-repair coupling factor [Fistulifera solaris]|eukprot:GAX20856.1 transcription-repair coupling factor [Fistulifera solaris]